MSNLSFSAKDPAQLSADVAVFVARETAGTAAVLHPNAKDKLVREVNAHLQVLRPNLGAESSVRLPVAAGKVKSVLVVGLPGDGDPTANQLRAAAGVAARALLAEQDPQRHPATVAFALPLPDAAALQQAALGALLGAYHYDHASTAARQDTTALVFSGGLPSKEAAAQLARAQVIAQAVNVTRDLVNTPPNLLYPEEFAARVIGQVKGTKVKAEVWDTERLAKEGCGGILAVGQGSQRGPRLVKLSYKPRKATRKIALVGKGITFDSGGLSLKPAKSMETMKSDMAGAAAVFQAVLAAAELQGQVEVTGWLCLAENMPSGTAQRPSDVITMQNGTTVEVLNTDAEGRLVLGDGLALAAAEEPELIVDVATLTGAQMVALGNRVSAVMGTEDARSELVATAEQAGEDMWPMPLPEELRASLKSKVADLANIGERMGGMLVAGLFLREFVGEVPWAHLDIAGPSFNEGAAFAEVPAGGTGVAVRTLIQLLTETA